MRRLVRYPNALFGIIAEMKNIVLLCLAIAGLSGILKADELADVFSCPPDDARPQVWWHWMGGNVSRDGIVKDLESMKAVGIGGVTLCDLHCEGVPQGPVVFASPEWFALVRFAAENCARLGLDFRFANCAGWTASGGPWVGVEDSMKAFVFSETNAVGGASVTLASPPSKKDFYREIAVVAFPVPKDYRKRPVAGCEAKSQREFCWGNVSRDKGSAATAETVDPSSVIDLSSKLKPDGALDWTAPSGTWRVIRCGYTTTAKCNFPAPRGGSGYEVDKLDVAAVERHFNAHCKKVVDSLGEGRKALKGILIDSYEVGPFSWTAGLGRRYAERWHESPLPLLVALAGHTVGSTVATDDLLWRYRRLVADLFARNYLGTMRRLANAEGLTLAVEPYTTPCDDLQFGRYCDIPMGEIWPSQKDMLTCPGCRSLPSSFAHFWGGRLVDAEAFTQNPLCGTSARWLWDPLAIKACGDAAFARGMNRFCIHGFAHQPWNVEGPGMTMGFWGIRYDRTEPWWRCTAALNRYLARCQGMLQRGRIVRDVLVYAGDGVPNRYREFGTNRFGFDIVGTEALDAVRVENGELVSPCGTRYAALVVQPCEWNGATVRARLDELKRQGVKTDTEALVPDVLEPTGGLRWIHRKYDDGTDGYFVCSPNTNEAVTVRVSFRQVGRRPELWDPESGVISAPAGWAEKGGRTEVLLSFERSGAVFVLFRDRPTAALKPPVRPSAPSKAWKPVWEIAFPNGRLVKTSELFDWSQSADDEIRYFTGTAVYRTDISGRNLGTVDFGVVKDFAEVVVDGRLVATLWKPPYRCAVPTGKTLEVRVVNGWPNRMIGDDRTCKPDAPMKERCYWLPAHGFGLSGALPDWVKAGRPSPTGRRSFATWQHWLKDDPLQPSGMIGPVKTE